MTDECKILMVEDDYEQANLISEFLKLESGCSIDWSRDIQNLWDLLQNNSYDVILLDYRLPDGTGLEVLKQLPERGYQLPVIMVTGQGDERIAAEAIQAGASDYIVKRGDFFLSLPSTIQKVINDHRLKLAVEQSMAKIRYQALLLDNVQDAVIVWDKDGLITFWNPAAESLFGCSDEDCLGKDVRDTYFSLFSPALTLDEMKNDFQEQERHAKTQNHGSIWISSRITCLKDIENDEKLLGFMDVVRDITQRKKMENEIKTALTQLTQSSRLAAIGELSSGVAHRIYNPLTTIIAEAQILQHNLPKDHPGIESLKDIEKAGWKAQEVVKQLLEFSRPSTETFSQVNINQTIQSALILIGAQIQSIGVNLEVSCEENLPVVHGNDRQIEDIWVNLLLLARDATSDGNPHTIKVISRHGPKDTVVVEVRDDGNQIPPEQIVRMFEPNFIGSEIGRGTGLELSICREIVRQHHGRIKATSDEKGTSIKIYFPKSNVSE